MFRRGIACVFGMMDRMDYCNRRGHHVSHVERMVRLVVWHSNMVDWGVSIMVQRFWVR